MPKFAQPKPHLLVAKVNRWGDLHLALECPYEFGDDRPCTLGMEPSRCDWYDFEFHHAHHDSCPAAKDRKADCTNPEPEGEAINDPDWSWCWPEVPDECDGWDHPEYGHLHMTPGCFIEELVSNIGWEDAIHWGPGEEMRKAAQEAKKRGEDYPWPEVQDLALPLEVHVAGDEEDGITLTPWDQRPAVKILETADAAD